MRHDVLLCPGRCRCGGPIGAWAGRHGLATGHSAAKGRCRMADGACEPGVGGVPGGGLPAAGHRVALMTEVEEFGRANAAGPENLDGSTTQLWQGESDRSA